MRYRWSLLAAVFAVLAFGVGFAQAEFESADPTTTVSTTADGTGKNSHQVLDLAGAPLTCPGIELNTSFVGTKSAPALFASVEFTGACNYLGQSAAVNMHGCGFNLHSNGELDVSGATCAANPMTVSVPAPACSVSIPPQTGLKTVKYTNIKPGAVSEITLELSLTGIKYTATGAGCVITGTKTDGAYTTGRAILTGEDTGTSNMVDIFGP